jgi:hypothetical protein
MDVEDADILIDNGALPKDLARVIPDPRTAATQYAQHLRHTFGFERAAVPGQDCFACDCRRATLIVQCRWNAIWTKVSFGPLNAVLLAFGHISVHTTSSAFGYDTHHPLCDHCFSGMRSKPARRGTIRFIATTLLLLGLFVAGVGLGGYFYLDAKPAELRGFLYAGLTGMLAILFGAVGNLYFARVRLSRSFKRFAARPFRFHSAIAVSAAARPEEDPMNDITRRAFRAAQLTWKSTLCALSLIAGSIFAGLWLIPPERELNKIGFVGVIVSTPTFLLFLALHWRSSRIADDVRRDA